MCIAVKRGTVILLVVFIIVHTIYWYSNKYDPLGPSIQIAHIYYHISQIHSHVIQTWAYSLSSNFGD